MTNITHRWFAREWNCSGIEGLETITETLDLSGFEKISKKGVEILALFLKNAKAIDLTGCPNFKGREGDKQHIESIRIKLKSAENRECMLYTDTQKREDQVKMETEAAVKERLRNQKIDLNQSVFEKTT